MSDLSGKVVLIVGGSTGLGLSAAKAFVEAEGRIGIIGRNSDRIDEALGVLGDNAIGYCGDARDPSTVPAAIERLAEQFGLLTGLYHVAGGSGRLMGDGPLHELTDEGWEATIRLNLTSVIYSNRAAVRYFRENRCSGSVLNCGSVLGYAPVPNHFSTHAYAAAKAGLIGLTRSCAATYAAEGIRFNLVAPALVATPMSKRAQSNETIMGYAKQKQPLAEEGIADAGDVDGAATYFMSDGSRGVTGQILGVDWGWAVSEGASEGKVK